MQGSEVPTWGQLDRVNWRRWNRINQLWQGVNQNGLNDAQVHEDMALIANTDFISIQNSGTKEVKIFTGHLSGTVEGFYRRARRNITLTELVAAVRNPVGQEVIVNSAIDVSVPVRAGPLLVGSMNMMGILSNKYPQDIVSSCVESMISGIFLGVEDTLKMVERPNTLLRVFTRDYFVGRGEILPDAGLGAVVTRPTRYRGVNLRYQFEPNQLWAYMFFAVDKIT